MQSSNKEMLCWRRLLVTFLLQILLIGGCYGIHYEMEDEALLSPQSEEYQNAPSPSPSPFSSPSSVRLTTTSKNVVLDNEILQVTFAVPEGFITGIRYGGISNVLNPSNKGSQRGYWDISSKSGHHVLKGSRFKIITQTEDKVEISFVTDPSPAVPLRVDNRYVMLRGNSGFYSYAIFEREPGLAPMQIFEIRTVYKLESHKFRYMAVSDEIRRIMPTEEDRESGRPLAYKEAVLLPKQSNVNLKEQVDDKYQYSLEDKDNKVHGWISFGSGVGVWIITPSDEFRMGGPHKQDLTAHVGPTLLAMFHSTHYAGRNLSMIFENGEPWKKVFGPYFVHLNSIKGEEDPRTLWKSAKNQMVEEVQKWPYDFPLSGDFPKADDRGLIMGKLLVNDSGNSTVPAANAWVGLTSPGEVGSWQYQVKGYQFWIQADSQGRFLINNVRVGNYSLFAWVPGFIGDYKYLQDITITPGKLVTMGDIVYTPPRTGPTLWEIGIPDRTAAEFYIPDPNPRLLNQVYPHIPLLQILHQPYVCQRPRASSFRYRQYGLWDRYSDVYPKEDLIYTVGVSDFRKDWFYAHVLRRTRDNYEPTTWQIRFLLPQVAPNTTYMLQIALASASYAELQVRINNPDLGIEPVFTTTLIGQDNAIARHGIHGLYKLYTIEIPSSLLINGSNTIFLTQSRGGEFYRGVMYDYLRLEGPPSI